MTQEPYQPIDEWINSITDGYVFRQDFSWENPLRNSSNSFGLRIESTTADSSVWIEERRKENEERERLYGESTRVPRKWGEELWVATIEDSSDLPHHSYTIQELRNVVDGMWEDIGETWYPEHPFPELAAEFSWDLSELQNIYRKLYNYMQENPSEEYDDPWGSWGLN